MKIEFANGIKIRDGIFSTTHVSVLRSPFHEFALLSLHGKSFPKRNLFIHECM